jgi:hypothetical protein
MISNMVHGGMLGDGLSGACAMQMEEGWQFHGGGRSRGEASVEEAELGMATTSCMNRNKRSHACHFDGLEGMEGNEESLVETSHGALKLLYNPQTHVRPLEAVLGYMSVRYPNITDIYRCNSNCRLFILSMFGWTYFLNYSPPPRPGKLVVRQIGQLPSPC